MEIIGFIDLQWHCAGSGHSLSTLCADEESRNSDTANIQRRAVGLCVLWRRQLRSPDPLATERSPALLLQLRQTAPQIPQFEVKKLSQSSRWLDLSS
jgi:hypothetical protein